MLQNLARYFVRGLLVLAPVVLTTYVVWLVFTSIDSWINVEALLDRRIPGAGVVVTLAAIVLTGFLASNVLTRWVFREADRWFSKLPVIKLLYVSMKDLVGAFVGDRKKFDRPVRFRPADDGDVELVGFLTRESLIDIGLPDHASIYVPMAYNMGGATMLVPRARLEPLELDGASAMTFALSGGVSGAGNGRPAR